MRTRVNKTSAIWRSVRRHAPEYLFLLPALVLYGGFMLLPLLQNIYFCFFEWYAYKPEFNYIGLENVRFMLTDPIFWKAMKNNIIYVVASLATRIPPGLIFAVILNSGIIRGARFFKTACFLPMAVSMIAASLLWSLIYQPHFGALNKFLILFHLKSLTREWLGDPLTALPAVILVNTWQGIGFSMIIFLAGLQNIPSPLYEAAKIAGATGLQMFRFITLPMLKNTTNIAIIITLILSFRTFEYVQAMTEGGPYYSSEVLATYMYRQGFRLVDMGYGSALANALFVLTITVVGAMFLIIGLGRKE